MVTLGDLPASALRLITRSARSRLIPGTNRFAKVSRSWRDAGIDSGEDEQLQLLVALEDLPSEAVASTSSWLAQHGGCVTSLQVMYDSATAHLFQQLPLSTAPLVGLERLELDGPDSLVALAPALPQLVHLTHLSASITFNSKRVDTGKARCVVTTQGQLEALPSLQQLRPGLKSLTLDISATSSFSAVTVPVEKLLPGDLEGLHMRGDDRIELECTQLAYLTRLRSLTLESLSVMDPDQLLSMPGLVDIAHDTGMLYVDHQHHSADDWLASLVDNAPQHLSKLTGMTSYISPPEMAPVLALAPTLRKLSLVMSVTSAAAELQQLSTVTSLRHLALDIMHGSRSHSNAVVSALSSVQHLTYLQLHMRSKGVQRSTWAAVLPHLTQLQVLSVKQGLLGTGLAAEAMRLTQLQSLYVECPKQVFTPAVISSLREQLQVLGMCHSLKAVLCWSFARRGEEPRGGAAAGVPLVEGQAEGGVLFSCWGKWREAAEEGRVVCPRACPHLPGVCELQQVPAGGMHNR
jgi:hypothetical protein